MALLNLKEILNVAQANKFAVGAFNAVDSHFVDAIFKAAEQNQSPIILNFAEVHSKLVNIEDMANYVLYKAKKVNVPVCLNLDHGLTLDLIKRAIACGFTSIMFDGSRLSYDENIAATKEVVGLCHPHNISVEGELGAVGGDEGGALVGHVSQALYTDVDQAQEFVARTNVDALAVAIGNSHGRYKGVPKLDFERLHQLAEHAVIPLVLHGGSGLSADDFRKSISLGIAKINYFTGMSDAALRALTTFIADEDLKKKYDRYLLIQQEVEKSISAEVKLQMEIFSSINKGQLYG